VKAGGKNREMMILGADLSAEALAAEGWKDGRLEGCVECAFAIQ